MKIPSLLHSTTGMGHHFVFLCGFKIKFPAFLTALFPFHRTKIPKTSVKHQKYRIVNDLPPNYPPLKFWLNVLIPLHGVRHFDGVLGVVFQLVHSWIGSCAGCSGRNKVRQLERTHLSWNIILRGVPQTRHNFTITASATRMDSFFLSNNFPFDR